MTDQTPRTESPKQQATEAIRRARRIVITAHREPDADAVGSSLALALALRKLGKEAQVILADPVPESVAWLSGASEIRSEFSGGRTLKVEIAATGEQIESLRYETEGGKLSVIIEPKGEPISPDSVRVRGGASDYDLLVVLDTDHWEHQGETGLERGASPVVVIDHHASNRSYGDVNWVQSDAASTSEMLLSLIESLGERLIDAEIATNLLAGLLFDTGGFLHDSTRAKTLSVAAQLVSAGADYGRLTRSILTPERQANTLRLWGHALSSLRLEPETGLAWAEVTGADLLEQGNPDSWGVGALMDNLLKTVGGARMVLLLSEPEPGTVVGSLRVPGGQNEAPDASVFARAEGGGGHPVAAGFRKESTSLGEVKGELLPRLREYLKTGRLESPAAGRPAPDLLPSAEDAPLPASAAERTAPATDKREPRVWQPDEPRA